MPLPAYLAKPKDKESFDEAKNSYLEHFIDEELKSLGKTRKQFIDDMTPPERQRVIAQATIAVLDAQMASADLLGRSALYTAMQIAKENLQNFDKDPETGLALEEMQFSTWLSWKYAEAETPGRVSEISFMIDLFLMYQSHGQSQYIEDLFCERKNMAKFFRTISCLREKYRAVLAIEDQIKKQIQSKLDQSAELKQAAEVESNPKVKAKLFEEARKLELKAQYLETTEGPEKVIPFQQDLNDTLYSAVVMSRMKEVHANDTKERGEGGTFGKGINQLLRAGVRVQPKKVVEKVTVKNEITGDEAVIEREIPDVWELVYPELPPEPKTEKPMVVEKVYVNSHVAYVIHTRNDQAEWAVQHALETFGDIKVVDPLYSIEHFMQEGELEQTIWQRLQKKLFGK